MVLDPRYPLLSEGLLNAQMKVGKTVVVVHGHIGVVVSLMVAVRMDCVLHGRPHTVNIHCGFQCCTTLKRLKLRWLVAYTAKFLVVR